MPSPHSWVTVLWSQCIGPSNIALGDVCHRRSKGYLSDVVNTSLSKPILFYNRKQGQSAFSVLLPLKSQVSKLTTYRKTSHGENPSQPPTNIYRMKDWGPNLHFVRLDRTDTENFLRLPRFTSSHMFPSRLCLSDYRISPCTINIHTIMIRTLPTYPENVFIQSISLEQIPQPLLYDGMGDAFCILS